MGFGMRKEVYTRKPKTTFRKMKDVYGKHLEDVTKGRKDPKSMSELETKEFRAEFARRVKEDNLYVKILRVVAIIAVFAFIVYAIILQWELWMN